MPNYDHSEVTKKNLIGGIKQSGHRISETTATESKKRVLTYSNSRGNFSDPINVIDYPKENSKAPINNFLSSTSYSSNKNFSNGPCVGNLQFELIQFEREHSRLQDLIRKRLINQRARAKLLAKHFGKSPSQFDCK